MSAQFTEHRFANRDALARALAAEIATRLSAAIDVRDGALLALSGGATPLRFFAELSRASLDWPKVTVTLCDERWVPPAHERSNERLLREHLLRGNAAAARFVPLYLESSSPEAATAEVARRIDALPQPFDAIVLGLGNDGHAASWFPGGDHLAAALDPEGKASVLPMRAPGAGEPRMTLTLPVVAAARASFLHIEGAEKERVFEAVVRGEGALGESPLRALLANARAPLAVYWSP